VGRPMVPPCGTTRAIESGTMHRVSAHRVIVVGAGPSGAVTALCLARAGHRVTILDRGRFPRDKPCGEGLMPPGVAVLRRLGLLDAVLASGSQRLETVTYAHVGAGPSAIAAFPPPPEGGPGWGLGVRRLSFDAVLVDALRAEPMVTVEEATRVQRVVRSGGRVTGVATDGGVRDAAVVVAADGLHSRLRAGAGWSRPDRGAARYGMAGHWRFPAAARPGITVSFAGDHEWYTAPVGPDELLVSVLAGRRRLGAIAGDYAGAARRALPVLRGAEMCAAPLAAGRFHQRARRIAGGGLFLVGDAAGYDDPTTGEGLAIGMELGERLAQRLGALLDGRCGIDTAERDYARAHRRLWRDRRRVTRLALLMATHRRLSRRAIARAGERPETLARLLGINCGYWGFGRLTPRDWLALAGL
jgi:2-polyprenyl-6-methoxyphenol hydroxylase-like FAD-dependent oxidoreductase